MSFAASHAFFIVASHRQVKCCDTVSLTDEDLTCYSEAWYDQENNEWKFASQLNNLGATTECNLDDIPEVCCSMDGEQSVCPAPDPAPTVSYCDASHLVGLR